MTTSVDTNILVALWTDDEPLNLRAQKALDEALVGGAVVISGTVFAELMAEQDRQESFIDSFCATTGIQVDWEISEQLWREAGREYKAYASRRRKQGDAGPRRILADFLIGAHAMHHGYRL